MMIWAVSPDEKKNCLPMGVEMYIPHNILPKYKSTIYIIAVMINSKMAVSIAFNNLYK
jgi:hypothetical protein